MAGVVESPQGSLRVARDGMNLGCHGGKPTSCQRACHSFGHIAGLVDELNGLRVSAATPE
jgi:hypothetical protein